MAALKIGSNAEGYGKANDVGELVYKFEKVVWSKVPHVEGGMVVNKTPLVDLSAELRAAARDLYNKNIDCEILAKEEWFLPSGSIKMRPAACIMHDAIEKGIVREGMPVFEATSGNFGISMGYMKEIGLRPFVVVSRKVYDGVGRELNRNGVGIIYLNTEICPTPGHANAKSQSELMADDIISQLKRNGLDAARAYNRREEIVEVMERNNPMDLAVLLAKIYDGFCPRQYENMNNIKAYLTLGREIEEQLEGVGKSLGDYSIVCTFGTGGTSTGLSEYYAERFGRKGVFVVFPEAGQDVAGIRTKEMVRGLKFYRPDKYAGELEIS